jgi:archaemetzincin
MNTVYLLPVGKVDLSILRDLQGAIPQCLPVACEILPYDLDPAPSYHAERQQFHSSEILQHMQPLVRAQDWRFVAITDVDLYIPILLGQRLLKECVHELGHTLDLRHCQEYSCVMASSHAVEWIDLRGSTLCDSCRSQVELKTSLAGN